jgi:hypothetical protein
MSERDFHLIFPHDVDKRQCVGHWLYACCVDSSQLIEIFEDFTYLLGIQKLFLLRKLQPCEFCHVPDGVDSNHVESPELSGYARRILYQLHVYVISLQHCTALTYFVSLLR